MPKLESIQKSHQSKFKYVATFCLCQDGKGGCQKPQKKEVYFGASGKDYTTGASDSDKLHFIARYQVYEDPLTDETLSRYILWGPTNDINENIRLFKAKFGV
jgi:hypothetical protein